MRKLTTVAVVILGVLCANLAVADVPTVDPRPLKDMRLPAQGSFSYVPGAEISMPTITWVPT